MLLQNYKSINRQKIAMEEVVRQDIIGVLGQGIDAIARGDAFQIKELSNSVIHNASIFQDEDSLGIAVLMYSLSKVMERGKLDMAETKSLLERARRALDAFKTEDYRLAIKLSLREISEIDSRLRLFVENVIEQAQLKKGCKICMHGISVSRASGILGISRWDLMRYLGRTTFHDEIIETVNITDRLNVARKVFDNAQS